MKSGAQAGPIKTEVAQIVLGGTLVPTGSRKNDGSYFLTKKVSFTAAELIAAAGVSVLTAVTDVPVGYQATLIHGVAAFGATAVTLASGSVALYQNDSPESQSLWHLAVANSTGFRHAGSANVNRGTLWPTLGNGKGAVLGPVDTTTESTFAAAAGTGGSAGTFTGLWLISPV